MSKSIKNMTVSIRIKMLVAILGVVGLVGLVWSMSYVFSMARIHDAVGVYGTQIASKFGVNMQSVTGLWYAGYDSLESLVHLVLFYVFVGGMIAGIFSTLIIAKARSKTGEQS